ncbi:MAG: class I SAM-dependent methyltransferase [Rubrivivax sp.]|nr:class I SAM-dependent methyltransferase [Rubrivivax sp.]
MTSKVLQDDARVTAAFRGEAIYGDDFSDSEIRQWFADEVHGYSSLEHEDARNPVYAYGALDAKYAWPHLPPVISEALGLGSAYGLEFVQLAGKVQSLTIVEPEQKFWTDQVAGIPARYEMPASDGRLPYQADRFGLVTAFGVLHHIPNVSAVFGELCRVLRPGGLLILREPIVSMGDWRSSRPGLTARERGLPVGCVRDLARSHGMHLRAEHQIGFGPWLKLCNKLAASSVWNNSSFVGIDRTLSAAFRWNYRYHRTTTWQRFAPTVGVWVCEKHV